MRTGYLPVPFSLILLGLQSSVNSDANPPLFAQISYGWQFIIGRGFIMVLAAHTNGKSDSLLRSLG